MHPVYETSSSTDLVPYEGSGPGATLAVVQGGSIVPTRAPTADAVDGYLRIGAHLMLEHAKRGVRTVGVISTASDEERTTAALNVAACLGRARGREGRVLLVDGDTRGRTLSRLLLGGVPRAGQQPVIARTAFEGVDFFAAPMHDDGPTIHAPGAWARTLAELAGTYPQIVVDCPALIDDPDAAVIADVVDALVLLVRADETTHRTVRQAVGRAAERVIGVMVTGVDAKGARSPWVHA